MQGTSFAGSFGLLLSSVFIALLSAISSFATELKVNTDHAILRAAASEASEVVFQLSEGDILVTDKAIDGEWVEVIPPSKVSFWVYGELVKDGVVASSRLQVRIGPGINYKAVGELAKDAKIAARGEYKEWIKIAPPPGCKVWVNRKSVDPADKPLPSAAVHVPAHVDKPVVPVKPVETLERSVVPANPVEAPEKHLAPAKPVLKPPVSPPPEEPAKPIVKKDHAAFPSGATHVEKKTPVPASPEMAIKDKLATSKEQGRVVRRDGVLRQMGLFVWRQPGNYRLVVHDSNGIAITVCYVIGDEKILVSMQDKDVVVQGREYWMQGVRQPVVIFDKILPKE